MSAEATAVPKILYAGARPHTKDTKGRVQLPADWNPADMGRIYISKALQRNCILCMPASTYQAMMDQVEEMPVSKGKRMEIIGQLSARNEPANIDAQGRITVPTKLAEQVGLGSKVMLWGLNDRFEIYSPEEYETRLEATSPTLEEIADDLGI